MRPALSAPIPETDALAPLVAALAARVRASLGEVISRPELVSQRTVAAVVGMPQRDYLRHVRALSWPSYSDRRLRYSKTEHVIAWLEAHPAHAEVDVDDAEAVAFARCGARRVAPSPLANPHKI
jgi:hypothetical protein